MICWISSFPRSGNTLTRQILEQSFGVKTYTVYSGEDATDHLFEGQNKYDLTDEATRRSLEKSDEIYYVKTHHVMFDGNPVIHIIRNGRDAIKSMAKLYYGPVESFVVMQGLSFPSWSNHYWGCLGVPSSLVLRFEDVVENPNEAAKSIGMFIGKEPKHFVNTFNPVNEVMGSGGKTKARFNKEIEVLFQRCHGVVMNLLGYV